MHNIALLKHVHSPEYMTKLNHTCVHDSNEIQHLEAICLYKTAASIMCEKRRRVVQRIMNHAHFFSYKDKVITLNVKTIPYFTRLQDYKTGWG